MNYILPTFNQTAFVGITHGGRDARLTCPGQLSWGRRTQGSPTADSVGLGAPGAIMLLLLPALTDIRDNLSTTGADTVEMVARGTTQYIVLAVDDFNKGTPAEFRGAVVKQISVTTPMG